jgi:hypothetical protein
LHEEENPSEPLIPGNPIAPHSVAERIGINPVGRWYAAALEYLEEEGVLERNVRPSDVLGDPRYVLGARGPELMGGGVRRNVPHPEERRSGSGRRHSPTRKYGVGTECHPVNSRLWAG